ncbi:RHS repeat-associated core domain-containing protein [Pseudomonas sp. SIMBA_077]
MSKIRKTLASTYQYDPLNRLTAANSVQRFYNNSRIASEIEGDRSTRFFETDSQPLAMQEHGSAVGTTLLATDQQTSVLSGVRPDGTQHAQVYTPFGHHANDALLNVPGFNGERPEPVTGHYLLGQGYRAFNPVLMRFNSPDSLSPFGDGGINAYAYCDNDPANKFDPTGHIPNFLKFKGIRNLFFGRVPKRLRPSTGVAPTNLSPSPSTQTVNPIEFAPMNPGSLSSVTDPYTPSLRQTRKVDAYLSKKNIKAPSYSLQTLAARAIPQAQVLTLPSSTKNILLKPMRVDSLAEFKINFKSLGDINKQREFLTSTLHDNKTLLSVLPKKLVKLFRES